jgi:hypothetical protein
VIPSLRKALLVLLAAVLSAAPLAASFRALANADCVVQQADLPGEGCCGDTSPGPVCALSAPASMTPAPCGALADHHRFVSPSAPLSASLPSQARAPDTAPPKPASA